MFDRHIISHCCLADRIDQSHCHRRSQVASNAGPNERTTTDGRWKTSAPAQLRPTTERALFSSASYSLTLRRSTRPLVQPTQKSYNCITITISIWVSSEHTTISSLAWYLLLIFTFLVAPCCLFNQIDLSHTNSLQVQDGPASHWPPFLWKAITTMSVSLPQWLQWDPIYLSCVMFIKLIVNDS